MPQAFSIAAFYTFVPLDAATLASLRDALAAKGNELAMGGLILLAPEGVNGTVAGSAESIEKFVSMITSSIGALNCKYSQATTNPFRRFRVKIREEIVTIGDTELIPNGENHHLSPEQWDAMLKQEDVVVIDARNDYETAIGIFEHAIDPKLKTFQEFPDYIRKANIPKTKKVMLYCTGGIRCEKAILAMQREGYEHVYQLDGGILRYLQEKPEGHFSGECFVFDHRVAVGKNLEPSQRYKLCPHCGDPADQKISCERCTKDAIICLDCAEKSEHKSCSKDCSYHLNKKAMAQLPR